MWYGSNFIHSISSLFILISVQEYEQNVIYPANAVLSNVFALCKLIIMCWIWYSCSSCQSPAAGLMGHCLLNDIDWPMVTDWLIDIGTWRWAMLGCQACGVLSIAVLAICLRGRTPVPLNKQTRVYKQSLCEIISGLILWINCHAVKDGA